MDSRFAFGEIEKELYNRFNDPLAKEVIEIEGKLEDFQIKVSNLDKKVSDLIEFSKNLNKMRTSSNTDPSLVLEFSIEISNISFTPRDFLETILITRTISKDKNLRPLV